jgi:hypothetical protein
LVEGSKTPRTVLIELRGLAICQWNLGVVANGSLLALPSSLLITAANVYHPFACRNTSVSGGFTLIGCACVFGGRLLGWQGFPCFPAMQFPPHSAEQVCKLEFSEATHGDLLRGSVTHPVCRSIWFE